MDGYEHARRIAYILEREQRRIARHREQRGAMIRALTQGKDGPLILVGITGENVKRMREEGQPINFHLAEFGIAARHPKASVVIFYGETHRAAMQTLEDAGIELPEGAHAQAQAIDDSLPI